MIREEIKPDGVHVKLPMVSMLPEDSLQRLRSRFGSKFDRLDNLQVQSLVTADLEGASVSNGRLQEICEGHPTDVSELLHGLVARGSAGNRKSLDLRS
jgi:ATP-dependent DNA helicase RecG